MPSAMCYLPCCIALGHPWHADADGYNTLYLWMHASNRPASNQTTAYVYWVTMLSKYEYEFGVACFGRIAVSLSVSATVFQFQFQQPCFSFSNHVLVSATMYILPCTSLQLTEGKVFLCCVKILRFQYLVRLHQVSSTICNVTCKCKQSLRTGE
jgi:hypothetical protein